METIERLWQADPRLQVVICTACTEHSWEGVLRLLADYANPVFERVTGYAAAEVMGRNPSFLLGADADQPVLAEIATNVLHNVGDVLKGVNVSADLIGTCVRACRASGFARAVQLIANAKQACSESGQVDGLVRIAVQRQGDRLQVEVADNGCGMAPQNLASVFAHGFTTRANGHGLGLHGCVLAAQDMGGTLAVHSDGPGRGARFTQVIPCGDVA